MEGINNTSTTNSSGIIFNYSKMEIPELKETKSYNGKYYLTSPNDKWFIELLDLYHNSSLHSAIINNLHRRIVKDNPNDELLSKITLDYLIFGGYSVKVNWNLLHRNIFSLQHMDFSKVRTGLLDEEDNVNFYHYSTDWFKYNNRKITTLQAYNVDQRTEDSQIFYFKKYTAGSEIYPRPYYVAGLEWIYTDKELKRYYGNLVKNNFVANTLITMPSFQDETKEEAFLKSIKEFTGSENTASKMVLFTENMTRDNRPKIERFNNEADDSRYQYITNKVVEEITLTHNIPASLLVQIAGKLSNSSDLEMYNQIYNDYMVQPIKDEIMKGYNQLQSNLLIKNNII